LKLFVVKVIIECLARNFVKIDANKIL